MLIRVTKWGNSLAVRIPAAYAKEIGVSDSSRAELSVENGVLVLKPVPDLLRFDLDDLIERITDENRHEEIGAGAAVGDEFG